MSRENSEDVTVELSAQDILLLRDRLMLIARASGLDASSGEYTAGLGQQFLDRFNPDGSDQPSAFPLALGLETSMRMTDVAQIISQTPQADLQAVGFDNAQDILDFLNGSGSVVSTLNQVTNTVGFDTVEQAAAASGGTAQPSAPEIPPEVRERVMRIEQQLQRAVAGLGDDANIPQMGAVDGVFDAQSFAAYEAMLAFMAEKAEVAVPAGGYTSEFGAELRDEMISKMDMAIMVYDNLPGENNIIPGSGAIRDRGLDTLQRQLGVDSHAEVEAMIESFRELKADLPQLVSDLDFLHQRGALNPVEIPSGPAQQAPTVETPVGPTTPQVQPEDAAIMARHEEMMIIGQLIGVQPPADGVYTPEFGEQVGERLEQMQAEAASQIHGPFTLEYIEEQSLDAVAAAIIEAGGVTDENTQVLIRAYIEDFDQNKASLDQVAAADRSFAEISAALNGGASSTPAPSDAPALTAEQQIVENHNQVIFFGDLLQVERPPNNVYTAEYGAQVMERMSQLGESAYTQMGGERPATQEAIYAAAATQLATYMAANISEQDLVQLGFASPDDVLTAVSGLNQTVAGLDAVIASGRSFEEISQTAQSQAQDAQTTPSTQPQGGAEFTAEQVAQIAAVQQAYNRLAENAVGTDYESVFTPLSRTDGVWTQEDLTQFNTAIELLQVANGLQGQFSGIGYEVGMGAAVEAKLAEDPEAKAALDELMPPEERATLFQNLDSLAQSGGLTVGGAAGTPGAPSTGADTEVSVRTATIAAEQALIEIGNALGGDLPGVAGMVTQFIPQDALFTPLTEAQAGDGVWDSASQDLASRVIMGLKYLDAQDQPDAPNNIDGTYNAQIGERLKISILTKPQFADIAAAMGLEQVEDPNVAQMIVNYDSMVAQNEAAIQQAMSQYGMTQAEFDANPQFASLHQERQRLQQLEQQHGRSIEAARTKLNAFFDNLTVLQQEGVYDNNEAKKTTTMNMMLDAASHMLDEFAPGLKTFLQDFFTNNEFGQMIAGILPMFGINVGRLWGDTDDEAGLERAQPAIENKFTDFYEDAREELGTDDHGQIMARTRDNIMEELDSSWRFKTAMDIMFSDQDEDVIRNAVDTALQAAMQEDNFEASKQAFTQSLIAQGQEFRNGREFNAAEVEQLLNEAQDEIGAAVAERPDFAPQPSTGAEADDALDNGTTRRIATDGASGGAAVITPAVDGEISRAPQHDASRPAIDEDVTEYGDQRVGFVYKANTEDMILGPERYSDGRVDDIQDVLARNAEALDLYLEDDMMRKRSGELTDTLTRNTNAVIEETLIRAQLHQITENGGEITQEVLDGLDRKLSLDNLDVVTAYMTDKGVSVEDINRFAANVTNLGEDYYSTVPGDRTAGPRQEHSVLEQSVFGGQFELNISDWAPSPADNPVIDEPIPEYDGTNELERRYLEGNRNCNVEGPLFYLKDGSDSVFALIRDKNGNDDPSDDTYRELEFDDYLETFRIQESDAADLGALLRNYNISNPTELGVRSLIECELGLEPPTSTHYMQPAPEPEPEATRELPGRPNYPHDVPETYTDLRHVTDDQRAQIVEMLGLDDNPAIMERAERDIRRPLDIVFEDIMQQRRIPTGTDFTILNLKDFGIEHPHIDVLVAVPSRDGLDLRYIDYDTDYIKPLEDQRASGSADINNWRNESGPRRLDDFLDEIHRSPGGGVIEGMHGGYRGMTSLMPYGDGGLIRGQNSIDAVYGPGTADRNVYNYIEAWQARANERHTYEYEQQRSNYLYRTGQVDPRGAGATDRSGYPSGSDRQRGFNNYAGNETPYAASPRNNNPFRRDPGENPHALFRILGRVFGDGDREERIQQLQSQDYIRQNMGDMGIQLERAYQGGYGVDPTQAVILGMGGSR